MKSTLLRCMLLLSVAVLIGFVVFLVNQTVQLVELAERFDPIAGQVTLYGLLGTYLLLLGVPALLLLRLPAPLIPADPADDGALAKHLDRLAERLRANPRLGGRAIRSRTEIEEALLLLDKEAEERIRAVAQRVFMTTAISQNGSLDGLLMLGAQSKLVLEIARIYNQRPSLRDLTFLYSNVATTTFIATEIEDIDLAEQVQPVIGSVLGSAAGAIPGLQAASSLIVNSVMNGAANAFLTLRVGLITQQYSRAVVMPERTQLRHRAVVRATQLLGAITLAGAGRISAAVWQASVGKVGGVVAGVGNQIKTTGADLMQRVGLRKGAETE